MKKINLWESSQKNNFIFFGSAKKYFNYLEANNLELDFITKTFSNSTDFVETEEDEIAIDNDIIFVYTDENHPIAFSNNKTYVNPVFFKKHIDGFKRYAIKQFEKKLMDKSYNITIPNFIFTNSLVSLLTFLKRDRNYHLKEFDSPMTITKEQIKVIKDNFISLAVEKRSGEKEIIGNKYVFNYYTLDDFKEKRVILIELPADDKTLNNLIHVGEKNTIKISPSPVYRNDEKAYYSSIKNVFDILSSVNHKFNIEIVVTNRYFFNNSNIINQVPENINLFIDNNRYVYNVDEYREEEKKLNSLVAPIKNSKLSPFEKYIAVYDIVKKFRKYKAQTSCCQENGDCDKSRVLKYVLEDDNDYIVCEGYERLLNELLNKVNIPSQEFLTILDITRDEGYDESKSSDRSGHGRNIVFINDNKYNIHGYYIADPTFDNIITDYDLYLNCLTTFDRKKEARRLEYLMNEDLILDFHNFDEFQRKINYYLKTRSKETEYKKEYENIRHAYMELYKTILRIIKRLDYKEYAILYNKYNQYLSDYSIDFRTYEKIANEMLTEYANYILPLSNNEVSFETILSAAAVVKRKINNYDEEAINKWLQETVEINEAVGSYTLPYIYDKNNPTEAYVKSRAKK